MKGEPAPRRSITYAGDQTDIMQSEKWIGPCRRGIMWRATHAEYDDEADRTRVVLAPVADYEIDQVEGLRYRLNLIQQAQALANGAQSGLTDGGMGG